MPKPKPGGRRPRRRERKNVAYGDVYKRQAQGYMDRGELVPDDVVMAVLQEHLLQGRAEPAGFVLDGVPRNIVQAEALTDMLGPKGLDVVINLDVSTEVVLRLSLIHI